MIADELRIVGSTQTNVVMNAELVRVCQRALRRRPPNPKKDGLGQLVLPFDREIAWAAATYMRTPTRVLWDVARTRAQRLEPLYDELVADLLDDRRTLWRDGDGISVEARRVEAFPAGERQIVGTVKNAIIEAARRRGARLHVDPERPALRWVARLDDAGELVVSIDLGGGSLSHRGWRRDAGAAPLREHLAAVLLVLARFDPRKDVLVDPMCGSGTIPIEAVHLARATPRTLPALRVLGLGPPGGPHDRERVPEVLFDDSRPIVIGCDIDLDVLAIARDNARAAGVAAEVTWQRADVRTLKPQLIADIVAERGGGLEGGLLLSNPPYGERLDEPDLRALYADIGETCRQFRGWRAGFLVGNPFLEEELARVIGRPRVKKPLANANLRAYFYLYDL